MPSVKRLGIVAAIVIGFMALAFLPRAAEGWDRITLSALAGGLLVAGGFLAGRR
jgi:hypothetical protein